MTPKMPPKALCRCGYDGTGPHPCHGQGYTCRRPATQRIYNQRPAHLAGVQLKLSVDITWACDDCWAKFADPATT